jgi:hypothetical protein
VARAQLRWNAGTKNVRSTAQRDLVPLPTQTGGIAYADPADSTLTSTVAAYNYPGALVVSSRGAYDAQCFKDASAAGCTVLLYIDALVLNATGRYHSLLYNSSAYGAAVSQWGTYSANSTGVVADFRVGGILQSKLEAVLELAGGRRFRRAPRHGDRVLDALRDVVAVGVGVELHPRDRLPHGGDVDQRGRDRVHGPADFRVCRAADVR